VLQTSGKTELMSMQQLQHAQLYNVDPDAAGALIYAHINQDSNSELAGYLAAAKAARREERMRMLERAKRKQQAHEARMYATCEANPNIPGCPYNPPLQFDLAGMDPDEAGSLIYAQFAKESTDNLDMMKKVAKKRFLDAKFQQDVVRYEKDMAGAQRLVAACNMNPSLPGCPYYPSVQPPQYPSDTTGEGSLIYAAEARMQQDKLHHDYLDNKAMMDRIHAQVRMCLSLRIYAYICACMYACMYIHIYIYIYTHKNIYTYSYIYTYIYIYIHIYVCIYVCIYTYIHVYI